MPVTKPIDTVEPWRAGLLDKGLSPVSWAMVPAGRLQLGGFCTKAVDNGNG